MNGIKYDITGLKNVKKAFLAATKVKVGVLSEGAGRGKSHAHGKFSNANNATVGWRMEVGGMFGEYTRERNGIKYKIGKIRVPARSWLQMPVATKLRSVLSGNQDFSVDFVSGGKKMLAKFIGKSAEKIINKAFMTRGFGRWAGNAPMVAEAKGNDTPLRDTDQLMNSVSSKVVY